MSGSRFKSPPACQSQKVVRRTSGCLFAANVLMLKARNDSAAASHMLVYEHTHTHRACRW